MSNPQNATPLIVGVGASAGGLESFQELLRHLGQFKDLAIVFVQHLDPARDSLLGDLLANTTDMKVIEITGRKKLKMGHIYIAPARQFLRIKNGAVRPVIPGADESPMTVVDYFFHSLAEDQAEQAVGIVLSGAGSDGTVGLKAISDAGGLTFAQDSESAKFDSMPRSAATTGVADYVCRPSEIAAELIRYAAHLSEFGGEEVGERVQKQIGEAIPHIAEHLLEVTGHNFQHYKIATLTRRIQRRMQILKIATASGYLIHLQGSEDEAHSLFRELLIGVTAFFRDPEAFDALATTVLPKILESKRPDETVRIWVAGCSTGEEAYSLAILFSEHAEAMENAPKFQIFATDIDERALQIARTGSYPTGVEDHVSPGRLKRYFVKRGKRYQVTKEIRDRVLFSKHNLISDPPFSRQDLISCRNLLIYLGAHLQEKLIPLFHYAIRPNGFLFLGPSETVSSHGELFRAMDNKFRISERKSTATKAISSIVIRDGEAKPVYAGTNQADAAVDLGGIRQRILLDEFAPRAAVIDESGQVLNASDGISKYLAVAGGDFQNNIVKMAVSGLRIGLRAAINKATKSRRKVTQENLSIRDDELIQRVMLTVQPMPQLGEDSELFLVVFHDVGVPIRREEVDEVQGASPAGDQNADAIIAQMESELDTTRSDLERTLQDMEAANEEMKSSNEELLSMNEELQSANEELETSKEEIRAGSDAVARINADLENLLRSTQIATVFLDGKLNIRSFTPAITEIYSLIPTDVGRSLERFVPLVQEMPPLPDPAEISDGEAIEHTIVAESGKSFIRRVLPYRSHTGASDGIVVMFTDVTDLRESEQQLLDAKARLELSLEVSDVAPWNWDVETNDVVPNPILNRLFGFDEDAAPALEEFLQRIDASAREKVSAAIQRSMQTGETYDQEYSITWSNGEVRHLRARGNVRKSSQGNIEDFFGVVIDVTDRKRRELDLAEREAHLRRVINNQLGLVGVIDKNGILLEVDERSLKIARSRREEVIGQHFADAPWWNYDNAVADRIRDAMQRAMDGEVMRFDVSLFSHGKDGVIIDFMIAPVFDDDGHVEYLIPSGVDIRDRVASEQGVKDASRRMKMALRAGGMAAWEWTPKKSIWTPELFKLLGVDPNQEARTDLFFSLVHPDDLDTLKEEWQRAVDGSDSYDSEFRIIRPDGEVRWIKGLGEVVRSKSGRVVRMYGMHWDSTREQQQAETLRQSERLAREASRSKSEFLANMSHEIRTPMTAILGYAELLDELVQQQEAKVHLDTIRRNGGYLLDIINDILDLSKIEANKLDVENEQFDPLLVIEDVRSIMEVRATDGGLSLEVEYDGKLPQLIRSDAKRLKQILINLVGNAIKFTPTGRVQIRVHFDSSTHQLHFDVVDTGIGISDEQMQILFQPFSQGDASVNRNFGGTGLGLVISQRLAEMLGGHVVVSSTVGVGSTFSVSITTGEIDESKLIDQAQLESINESEASVDQPDAVSLTCHVLIVDDRRDIRFLSKRLLTGAGATVDEAEDGELAVEAVKKAKNTKTAYDLILLDMQMPKLDGYQTAQALRSLGYAGPIIALTADAMQGDMNRCLECGCNDYLSKPIDKAILLDKVSSYIQKSKPATNNGDE